LRPFAPQAWAALLVAGCAGAGGVHPGQDPLRAEIQALRKENEALSARVEALSGRVDMLAALAVRPPEPKSPPPDASKAAPLDGPPLVRAPTQMIPPDLAIVKVTPEPEQAQVAARAPPVRPALRSARVPPPVPTSVAIQEPDPARLDSLAPPRHRSLASEAEEELRKARALTGLLRAHALEDFAARYPQHAAADNALVEAAAAYGAAGRESAACALARRVLDEYPAGDALSEALERAAACEGSRGATDAEQRLLARLLSDFPGTPAAQRAGARLTQLSGHGGEIAPHDAPARSGP
jgi:hypothetical protein